MIEEISQEQQVLLARIDKAEGKLKGLESDLATVSERIEAMADEYQKIELLGEICDSLERLQGLGAADLFWGDQRADAHSANRIAFARESITAFERRNGDVAQSRQRIEGQINEQVIEINLLNDELEELLEQEERARYDYVVEREERPHEFRPMLMPWSEPIEDKNRLRKSLAEVAAGALVLTLLIALWKLPPPQENQVVEVPKRLVRLVQKEQPQPMVPKVAEKKKEKKPEDKNKQKKEVAKQTKEAKPKRPASEVAKRKVQKTGLLAFKNNFSDLLNDDANQKMGAAAKLTTRGRTAIGNGSRNLVMAKADTTSGGINTATLSRGVGNGSGTSLEGVAFTRVTGEIEGNGGSDDRPLSSGPGPSRTDEEIQIVFDRYKAALYRIYNRQLRVDPTLKGKMVLRITIEPDGTVSFVKVESTDMDSPTLSGQIVARVERFNFGPKEGVPKITILYPIDFLPAT